MRGILGKKVGMTQLFDKSGAVIPVTIIEAGPCYVTQVKTVDTKDKYNAVQIGFEEVAGRRSFRFICLFLQTIAYAESFQRQGAKRQRRKGCILLSFIASLLLSVLALRFSAFTPSLRPGAGWR